MKIAVTASGTDLDAPMSPRFGRCSYYVFVDTETMAFEAMANASESAGHGAGVGVAQFVIDRGAEAVITGNVGPNAMGVLQAANIPVYLYSGGSVRSAVQALKEGKLEAISRPTTGAHSGMGGGGRGRF